MSALEKLPATLAGIGAVAFALTVAYLFGFQVTSGISVMSHCGLTDYARLAVGWIGPLAVAAILVNLFSLPLGRYWWLLEVAIVLALLAALIWFSGSSAPSVHAAAANLEFIVVGNIVTFVLMLAAVWAVRQPGDKWELASYHLLAAAIMVLALSRGLGAGAQLKLASGGLSVLETEDAAPVTGTLVFRLEDSVLFQETGTGIVHIVPWSRVHSLIQR